MSGNKRWWACLHQRYFFNLLYDTVSSLWENWVQQCHSFSKQKNTALKASWIEGWINHIRNVKIHNEQEPCSRLTFFKRWTFSCSTLHFGLDTSTQPLCYLACSDRFWRLADSSQMSHTLSNPLHGSNDFSSQHSVTQTVTYLNIKPPIWGTGLWWQTANLAAPCGCFWSWN